MTRFVALLRGINVGKAKRVPMVELRALLAELGHSGITTLLNSGNAVFHAAASQPAQPARLAADIATLIRARLAVEVPVMVKSAQELAAIAAENTLAPHALDHSRLLVAFVQDPKDLAALSAVVPRVVAPERFVIGKHAAYLDCASGILDSKAGAALVGAAGPRVTTRNWATVLKLLALANAPTP